MSAASAIFLHSPVDVLSKFTSLFQHRFSEGPGRWQWSADENETNIFVSSELSIPKDFTDAAPAIIVTRGSFAHARATVGDTDQNNSNFITKGAKNFWAPGQGDLRIECVGRTQGESMTIADIVRSTVHMTREPICKAFSLRNISAVVTQRTVPYERDKTKWMTAVEFRVEFEERWQNVPAAPELRKLDFTPNGTTNELPPAEGTPPPEPAEKIPWEPIAGPNLITLESGDTVGVSDAVFLHSPLNLLSQFTSFFRTHFAHGRTRWLYSEDANQTKIHVEAEFSIPDDTRDVSPLILVTRGSVAHGRDVIGDDDQNAKDFITKGGKNKWGTGECDLRIQIVAQTKGEASILGDVVTSAVHMTREPICKAFTLRDISEVTMSPVVPYERDKTKWLVNVDFRVRFEERWFGIPVAPELRKLDFRPGGTLSALTGGAFIPAEEGESSGNDITIGLKDEKARVSADDDLAGFLADKIVAGANVTITVLNDGANEQLEISSSGGGGGGTSNGRRDYLLGADKTVPGQGTLYLSNGQVNTAAAPILVNAASSLISAAVRPNVADGANAYAYEILVNDAVAATVTLGVAATQADDTFAVPVAAGDRVSARLRRTSGSGPSAFTSVNATLELEED